MHLGLTPWRISGRVDARELGRQGALAESWGYESFWLPENHFGNNAIPDPLMLLAAVAATTSTIRLGTTSYLLPLRHPLQAAEQVAVLDRLSGGRVILGVGRGYQPAMFDAFSVSRRDKRRIFEWCLNRMISAWRGEPIPLGDEGASGEGGERGEVTLSPLPVQQPHPPIWVAAFGPKALAQAGRLGSPYLASPMEPVERLRANYERHAAACEAAGVAPAAGGAGDAHRVRLRRRGPRRERPAAVGNQCPRSRVDRLAPRALPRTRRLGHRRRPQRSQGQSGRLRRGTRRHPPRRHQTPHRPASTPKHWNVPSA